MYSQVFEYSFHQLRVRNAEEMRGRLHITFQNEDGIDAGGLTREWCVSGQQSLYQSVNQSRGRGTMMADFVVAAVRVFVSLFLFLNFALLLQLPSVFLVSF